MMTEIEALQARVTELEEALMVRCDCGVPAICHVYWSDREAFVCGKVECLRKTQHNHDFDHSYDQVGGGPRLDQYWHQHPVLRMGRLEVPRDVNFLPQLFAHLYPGVEFRTAEMWREGDFSSLPKCKKCGCLVISGRCVDKTCPCDDQAL
jgi:hypothetical protein